MSQRPRPLSPLLAVQLLLALAAPGIPPSSLQAQEPLEWPQLRVGAAELSVGGRLHTQLNTTDVDGQPPSQLFIRRARIEIGVKVNDRVSGAIQPDFGGDEVDLKDAYVKFTFSPAFELLAGKAYRPFGLLEQTSSKRILPVERGLRIRGLGAVDEYAVTSGLGYSNREIGLQILGAPEASGMDLEWAAGIFRGPLHNQVGDQDSYQFAARATLGPTPDVRIGAGWSSRHFTDVTAGGHDLERGHAFEMDLEYGRFGPGFHLLAEVSTGDLNPHLDATFTGAQTWLAWRSEELGTDSPGIMVEPLFRLSWAATDTDGPGTVVPGGTLLTPGLNVYFGPLNRIMVNYDVWQGADESPDATSFKLMFQLGF